MIRPFQPDIDLEEVRPKQLLPRHAGYRGEVARAVMNNLEDRKAAYGRAGYPDTVNPDSLEHLLSPDNQNEKFR